MKKVKVKARDKETNLKIIKAFEDLGAVNKHGFNGGALGDVFYLVVGGEILTGSSFSAYAIDHEEITLEELQAMSLEEGDLVEVWDDVDTRLKRGEYMGMFLGWHFIKVVDGIPVPYKNARKIEPKTDPLLEKLEKQAKEMLAEIEKLKNA